MLHSHPLFKYGNELKQAYKQNVGPACGTCKPPAVPAWATALGVYGYGASTTFTTATSTRHSAAQRFPARAHALERQTSHLSYTISRVIQASAFPEDRVRILSANIANVGVDYSLLRQKAGWRAALAPGVSEGRAWYNICLHRSLRGAPPVFVPVDTIRVVVPTVTARRCRLSGSPDAEKAKWDAKLQRTRTSARRSGSTVGWVHCSFTAPFSARGPPVPVLVNTIAVAVPAVMARSSPDAEKAKWDANFSEMRRWRAQAACVGVDGCRVKPVWPIEQPILPAEGGPPWKQALRIGPREIVQMW
ncbi:hypothetical protein C8J57DRAFT_1673792 [Mycena rebaudengoi]|nr:hypothetical protein C8J57DRAFT_1673792 [Mycena rebaudengoi]